MNTERYIKVQVFDSGAYLGEKLIPLPRFISWKLRGYVQHQKGKTPIVQLNAYKFEVMLRSTPRGASHV